MSTLKYLTASTDSPRGADVKRMTLPVPQPEQNEYRLYYNHREVEREEVVTDEVSGEPAVVSVSIPTADYVSVQADHEPTDDEWRETLAEQGFEGEEIEEIIEGE